MYKGDLGGAAHRSSTEHLLARVQSLIQIFSAITILVTMLSLLILGFIWVSPLPRDGEPFAKLVLSLFMPKFSRVILYAIVNLPVSLLLLISAGYLPKRRKWALATIQSLSVVIALFNTYVATKCVLVFAEVPTALQRQALSLVFAKSIVLIAVYSYSLLVLNKREMREYFSRLEEKEA